jgi:hypothetical protein
MRKVTFSIGLLGIFALTLGGCSGDSSTTATSPSPSVSPSASPVAVASPTPAQPFSSPPVVPAQTFNPPAVAGLVQPTNSDERVRVLEKGRQDPFAVLPVQPIVTVSPDPNAPLTRSVPQVPVVQQPQSAPAASRSPIARAKQVASQARQTGNSGANSSNSQPRTTVVVRTSPRTKTTTVKPAPTRATRTVASRAGVTSATTNKPGALPSLTAPPLFTPQLPKLPEPELARSVEVTGVVQVGGLPQAIIKAPNETASRYVQPGQRLSNGQVLVKRIEMNEGSAPIVVLEQYGIEVARQVGDKPTGGKTGTPTAALPTSLRNNLM